MKEKSPVEVACDKLRDALDCMSPRRAQPSVDPEVTRNNVDQLKDDLSKLKGTVHFTVLKVQEAAVESKPRSMSANDKLHKEEAKAKVQLYLTPVFSTEIVEFTRGEWSTG
jgi:hypothetical protein